MFQPDLSVLIPTRPARLPKLRRLLASIADTPSHALARCEMVLVVDDDDSSPIETAAQILPAGFPLHGVCASRRGLAPTKNTAIERANGRWLLFLDDDLVLDRDSIPRHLRAIDAVSGSDEPLAFVGAVDWPSWLLKTRWDDLLAHTPMLFFQSNMRLGQDYNFRHFIGGHTCVPAELLRRAGGFDERFGGLMHEDIELGWRLEQEFGLRVRRVDAQAWHDHPLSVREYFEREHRAGLSARHAQAFNPSFYADVWGKLGKPDETLEALSTVFAMSARQARGLLEELEQTLLTAAIDPAARHGVYLAHVPLKRMLFCAGASGQGFEQVWSQLAVEQVRHADPDYRATASRQAPLAEAVLAR